MNSIAYRIAYPEYRSATAAEIASWYADALANGELEGYVQPGSDPTPDDMANALHDAGHIRLACRPRDASPDDDRWTQEPSCELADSRWFDSDQ